MVAIILILKVLKVFKVKIEQYEVHLSVIKSGHNGMVEVPLKDTRIERDPIEITDSTAKLSTKYCGIVRKKL